MYPLSSLSHRGALSPAPPPCPLALLRPPRRRRIACANCRHPGCPADFRLPIRTMFLIQQEHHPLLVGPTLGLVRPLVPSVGMRFPFFFHPGSGRPALPKATGHSPLKCPVMLHSLHVVSGSSRPITFPVITFETGACLNITSVLPPAVGPEALLAAPSLPYLAGRHCHTRERHRLCYRRSTSTTRYRGPLATLTHATPPPQVPPAPPKTSFPLKMTTACTAADTDVVATNPPTNLDQEPISHSSLSVAHASPFCERNRHLIPHQGQLEYLLVAPAHSSNICTQQIRRCQVARLDVRHPRRLQ